MKFIAKYTWSNIRANKLRAILLICCIAFASVLFFVSLAFPLYLKNYHEGIMRSYFGNSDVYMQATNETFANLDTIPDKLKSELEYSYGFFALPSKRYCEKTNQDELITYIAANFDEVQVFNPVSILQGDTTDFDNPEKNNAIITESTAKKFGWKVGDVVQVIFLRAAKFKICAIVANEGLLAEDNEATGPIMMLSRSGPGVYSVLDAAVDREKEGLADDDDLKSLCNMAVFKVKNGFDVQGVAAEMANLFPTYEVHETVNNDVLNQAVSFLRTPFVACIYLVCAFCALIIYLTCKLTFAERVRQFAVLKSMGATTGSLFFSLLLESAFYGFVGSLISIVFAVLQVYVLPLVAPQMTYIVPVSASYYVYAILFGVLLAVGSSFTQALKNARKSIKQTMLVKEKFTKQKLWVSIVSTSVFVLASIALIVLRNFSNKSIFIPLFLFALAGMILALPFVMSGLFWLFKQIYRKRTFEGLYLKKTLPSKNLSVANRLLFFGMFLVFLFSTLITSLSKLSRVGQEFDYNIKVSQVSNLSVDDENFEKILQVQGVERAWKGVYLKNPIIVENNKYLQMMYGLEAKDIARLYENEVHEIDDLEHNLKSGQILVNKYFRDTQGFKLGDSFSLNIGLKSVQTVEFEIVGFIDNYENWGDMAVCLLEDLQCAENVHGFNTIFIETTPGADAERVITDIRGLDFIDQSNENSDPETSGQFLTFTNIQKQQEIFLNQIKVPMLILRTYSFLVLVLSLLCILIGYLLYLRESSEYHKSLFALGMSPNRFEWLIVKQSVFMTITSLLCATALSAVLYLNFENIFNSLGTSLTTQVDYFEYSMYAVGMFAGTTFMSIVLGAFFKRDLSKGDKRLFG